MLLLMVLLFIEAGLCNIIFMPNYNTDMELVSLLLLMVNSIIFIFVLQHSLREERDGKLFLTILFSYILRIMILLWDIYAREIFTLPNSGSDTEGFHLVAVSYAFLGRSNILDFTDYSFYIGMLYKFIGIQRITAQYINVFLSIWALLIVYKIFNLLEIKERYKKAVLILAAFLPNLMLISSILLRETLIYFLLVVSLWYFCKWWKHDNLHDVVIAILLSFFAAAFHSGAVANAIAYMLIFAIAYNKDRKIEIKFGTVLFSLLFLTIFLFLYDSYNDTLFRKFEGVTSAQDVLGHTTWSESEGAGYAAGIPGVSGTLGFIVNTPIRALYFLLAPLPWDWRGIGDIMAFCFSAVFYLIALRFAIKVLKLRNKNTSGLIIALLIICLAGTLIFGWGVSNAGTALRHREKFTLIYVVLLAVSLDKLNKYKEEQTYSTT